MKHWIDLALGAGVLAVAVAMFAGTANVAAPTFEPLGSGAFPRVIALGAVAMALIIVAQSLRTRPTAGAMPVSRRSVLATLGIVVASVLYAASMASGWLEFRYATPLFVVAAGTILKGPRLRGLLKLVALGLLLGFGGHFVATHVVVIDLP